MQILPQTELDFSDVLIKPRRSTICSRKDANIKREYRFKWFNKKICGTGIMNANMGTIGTFKVAKAMLKDGLFTCLHKHHDQEKLFEFYNELKDTGSFYGCFLSIGLKDNGLEKVRYLNKKLKKTPPICIDVPNGYIPQVKELVMRIRKEFPNCLLMVGNVVTGDIVEDLILSGADIVKCGIGQGGQCGVFGTPVLTKNGIVEIQNIQEGDFVLTHTGEYHKVLKKFCYTHHHEKININGVEFTPEHKFLVINKKDKEKVTEENLMEYAYWVEACNLNEEELLIKRNTNIEFIEIKKGKIESNDQPVFDIEVEKDNSFVVGDGYIVHNCMTRKITGVGRPQFSTIVECADAAHQVGGMVCSDGGITCPGDIGKAFGAGADFIMIGSLYAGTDEAEGEIITKQMFNGEYDKIDIDNIAYRIEQHLEEKKFKQFYGMSSTLAQEKFGNGKPNYRASEGRITLVPYSGTIQEMNEEFLGGLRSTMTYIGATKLKDIPKCCVFYRVNNQLNRTYESTTIGK